MRSLLVRNLPKAVRLTSRASRALSSTGQTVSLRLFSTTPNEPQIDMSAFNFDNLSGSEDPMNLANASTEPEFIPSAQPSNEGTNEKKLAFQTETKEILNIVINSLYTDKDVFLRELISNASDALEKRRYFANANNANGQLDEELKISIETDEKNNTITIIDNGVGMTEQELITNLGTIAKSGSKAFVKEQFKNPSAASNNDKVNNIIGQFGVGFYSSYMVGSQVKVFSQSSKDVDAPSYYWESEGVGEYKLVQLANKQPTGSRIIITLKDECKDIINKFTLENIIKKHSSFVGFPIYLNNTKLNNMGALWLKNKSSIKEEEYNEFYKTYTNSYDLPFFKLHFNVDSPINLNALLFIPSSHMEKYGMGRMESNLQLFSKKVLIMKNGVNQQNNLLPEWLRFVSGVIDSEDIPLNISRESMQNSNLIMKINSIVTKKLITFLNQQSKADRVKYNNFFSEFGNFIKEGVCSDYANKNEIAKLLRFNSSLTQDDATASAEKQEELTSLDEYISRMKNDQKNIYYLSAPNKQSALNSPYYEYYKEKKIEVLFFYSGIDDFVMKNLGEYHNRKLLSIESTDSDINSSSTKDETKKDEESSSADKQQDVNKKTADNKDFLLWLENTLIDHVREIKISSRLVSSPCLIIDHESAAMRKVMKYVDQTHGHNSMDKPLAKQKMEINIDHPILQKLNTIYKGYVVNQNSNPDGQKLAVNIAKQLFYNALLQADILDNPRTIIPIVNDLMSQAMELQITAKP